jgi:hypothetical protein
MNTNTPTLANNQAPPTNSEASGIPASHALPVLTDTANGWLNAPVDITPGGGTTSELAAAISVAFNLTPIEGLTAVVGALSLAVGPGVFVQNPFGGRLPLSMQLWVAADANPNLDRAMRHLCQDVVDAYAAEFGCGIDEDDKVLIAQQVEVEKALQQCAATEKLLNANPPGLNWTPPQNAGKQQDLLLKHLRILRKRCSFPFGNIVNTKIITELTTEERDFCFGSFSPDGSALAHLLMAASSEQEKILSFLNAGFQGALLTHNLKLPIFPVVSAVWLCPSELLDVAFAKEIHIAVPGALVVPWVPVHYGKPTPMPKDAREKWKHLVTAILQTLRLPFHRRYTENAQGHTCSLDAEAVETLSETLDWGTRFTSGPGHPRTVLARSP